jgi:hypothetical protein
MSSRPTKPIKPTGLTNLTNLTKATGPTDLIKATRPIKPIKLTGLTGPTKSPTHRVKFREPLCFLCNYPDYPDTPCVPSPDPNPDPDTSFAAHKLAMESKYKLDMETKHKEVCDCGKMDNSCPRGGGGVVIPTATYTSCDYDDGDDDDDDPIGAQITAQINEQHNAQVREQHNAQVREQHSAQVSKQHHTSTSDRTLSVPAPASAPSAPTPSPAPTTSAAPLIEEEEEVLNLRHMLESIGLRGAPWYKNTPITVCYNCLRTSKVSKCGQCGRVAYCSKSCQKADWSDHKKKCKGLALPALPETRTTIEERFVTIFDYLNTSLLMGRDPFTHAISWAVPCMETIKTISLFCLKHNLTSILEIGAGHGLWALLLQMTGLTVHATDPCVSHGLENTGTDGFFTTVERLSHTGAIKKYVIDEKDPEKVPKVLFLCWPGHNEPFAAETIKMFAAAAAETPGDKYLIYIGEPRGGCCADDRFFDIIRSSDHISFDVPRWPGIYDSGKIFRLKR